MEFRVQGYGVAFTRVGVQSLGFLGIWSVGFRFQGLFLVLLSRRLMIRQLSISEAKLLRRV